MKLPLLVLGTFLSGFVFSQQVSEKEMQKHMKEVEKSKEKGSVIWDLDTVYAGGVPYCIIKERPSPGALFKHDYSVQSLAGVELIYVKYNIYNVPANGTVNPYGPANSAVAYYSYYFNDTHQTAELPTNRVFKMVYENQLISGNQINSDAEAKFVTLNGTKYSQALAAQTTPPPVVAPAPSNSANFVVKRNRMAGIFITNGSINQDNVVVGTVTLNQVAENGDITKTMTFFLPNGVQVAQATCIGINNHTWRVVTTKDNRFDNVISSFNNDDMDITKYLINGYYL